uniref:Uncharacterized protein n=1 Tax=Arion vulgaris TaxID=1028688 RepID=A0A0B7A163_9EUPU
MAFRDNVMGAEIQQRHVLSWKASSNSSVCYHGSQVLTGACAVMGVKFKQLRVLSFELNSNRAMCCYVSHVPTGIN